ncbi:NIPSNAP domain-containing protein [Rhodococcus opacus]|nr:NIPSNAP domain-containing protein [Rhodococcus opacus]
MFELRTYTLRTAETLDQYANVHWPRHISSLGKHGITTHGIWTEHSDDSHRLIALVSYQPDADIEQVARDFMASAEFTSDMAGFDMQNFTSVDTVLLETTASSPLR